MTVKGFGEDRVDMACDTSFQSSQKVFYDEGLLFLMHHQGRLTSDLRAVKQQSKGVLSRKAHVIWLLPRKPLNSNWKRQKILTHRGCNWSN